MRVEEHNEFLQEKPTTFTQELFPSAFFATNLQDVDDVKTMDNFVANVVDKAVYLSGHDEIFQGTRKLFYKKVVIIQDAYASGITCPSEFIKCAVDDFDKATNVEEQDGMGVKFVVDDIIHVHIGYNQGSEEDDDDDCIETVTFWCSFTLLLV